MKKTLIIVVLVIIALFATWYFNIYWLATTTVDVYSDKIENEMTIVHITDLHGYSFGTNNQTLIEMINNAEPDLVCVTGDMHTSYDDTGREVATDLLTNLAKEHEVYFVNGEHDYSTVFLEDLAENNVNVINYEDEIIEVNGNTIHIYGINNQYFSPTFDLENEFEKDSENFNLLLAHASKLDKFSDFGIDLTLCGDTHGGQVRLPFIGAVFNRGYWLPELEGNFDATHTKGLYEYNGSTLFVSSGLGNGPIPIRFMNQPEVAVINLKPEE